MVAEPGRCVFLQGVARLDLPIAHGEGKFVCRDSIVLERLRANRQIVLRYALPHTSTEYSALNREQAAMSASQPAIDDSPLSTESPLPYPMNPNGSQANIAGICDTTGRVFGLMPHPERHVDATQHPQWTRRPGRSEGEGLALFRNAVRFFSD
jgi:phosphoribosylformylglycinamidine synthase